MAIQNDSPWSSWMDNPYMAILEESPGAAYFSYADQWNSPAQQQYYQNQFQNVYNQYLGTLGTSLRSGASGTEGAPSISDIGKMGFTDYLGGMDWTDRYTSLPPTMRGDYTSSYNPRTRQIYF